MTDAITLSPLTRGHYRLLAEWLKDPVVHRWWDHRTTPDAIEADFGPSIDGVEATEIFVISLDDRPCRIIQRYVLDKYPEYLEQLRAICPVPPGALSIDYLLGVPDVRGRGLGAAVIGALSAQSWPRFPAASACLVAVSTANRASWRTLENAGFHLAGRGELEPDNPIDSRDHVVYRRDRPVS